METSNRLHALDNLRALLMWLGIMLHVSVNHLTGESPMPWRDTQTSVAADIVVLFIHSFRMPAFFVLSGFFVALLLQRRGAGGMLKHRLMRIGLPFLIFWPLMFAGVLMAGTLYMNQIVHGHLGFDASVMPQPPPGQPQLNTMHLWFLYLLIWFSVLAAGAGALQRRVPAGVRAAVSSIFKTLGARPWGFLVLALPLAVVGSFYGNGIVKPSGSFLPPLAEWIHNGLFFVFGIALHAHRDALLPLYTRRWPAMLVLGLLFFGLSLVLLDLHRQAPGQHAGLPLLIGFAYNCVAWLWSLALIGLFLRVLPRQNALLGYLSDSSYWVYLVHMMFAVGFGAVVYALPLGAFGKIVLNVAATTLACLLSYQLLVRHTPIGRLLNGPRPARRPAPLDAALPVQAAASSPASAAVNSRH